MIVRKTLAAAAILSAVLPIAGILWAEAVPGCLIERVEPKSVAEGVGLKAGDVIIQAKGVQVRNISDLRSAVGSGGPAFPLVIHRGSDTQNIPAYLPEGHELGIVCAPPVRVNEAQKVVPEPMPLSGRQSPQPSHRITALLGAANPITRVEFDSGEDQRIGEPGPAAGIQYLYMGGDRRFGFGMDVLHQNFSSASSDDFGVDTSFSFRSTTALVIARVAFFVDQPVSGYLLAGMGISSTHLSWSMKPPLGFYWRDTETRESRDVVDGSDIGAAFALGGGIEHHFSDRWVGGLEVRLLNTGDATYRANRLGQSFGVDDIEGNISSVSILMNIGYKFGGSTPAASTNLPATSEPAAGLM